MPTITLSLPEEVRLSLKLFSWINWSEIAREIFLKEQIRLEAYEEFKRVVSKSKFTEKDAKDLSDKVKLSMHNRLKSEGLI